MGKTGLRKRSVLIHEETPHPAMGATHHDHHPDTRGSSSLSRRVRIALLMVALIGGFYLLREHWIHVAAIGCTCCCWRTR